MPYAPRALTPVFGIAPLELEGAETVSVDGQLLLKLVQEVCREAVDFGGLGMAWEGVLIWNLKVRVIMDPGESAAVGNLVVEWEEAVAMEGIWGWKPGVHGIGVSGAEEIWVPVLGGIERVLRGVQVIREVAASVIS